MKITIAIIKLIGITIFFFLLITDFSHTNELQVDGCETYGFPYNFYEICADPPIDFEGGFKTNNFILDILILFGIVFLFKIKQLFKN
jgi:hypothetical protein